MAWCPSESIPAGSGSVELVDSFVGLEGLDAACVQGFRRDHRHLRNEFQQNGLWFAGQVVENLSQIEEARWVAVPSRFKRSNVFARPSLRWTGTAPTLRASEPNAGSVHAVISVDARRQIAAMPETLGHQRAIYVLGGSIDSLDRLCSFGHDDDFDPGSRRPNVARSAAALQKSKRHRVHAVLDGMLQVVQGNGLPYVLKHLRRLGEEPIVPRLQIHTEGLQGVDHKDALGSQITAEAQI